MANVRQKLLDSPRKQPPTNSAQGGTHHLDKLAQDYTTNNDAGFRRSIESFKKRAKSKTLGVELTIGLVNTHSPLKPAYWRTLHCNEDLLQYGRRVTAQYCKNRWCPVCNRIRTAELINTYTPVLRAFKEPQFVTLSAPTCKANELDTELRAYLEAFKRIKGYFQTRKNRGQTDIYLKGIRKIEVTYNQTTNEYHPHYHLVVEGKANAEALRARWLYEFPSADRQAQDIRRADEHSIKELFKYITKLWKEGKDGSVEVYSPEILDTIFRAMKGKQAFKAFGIQKVTDPVEDIETVEVSDIPERIEAWRWEQVAKDWVSGSGEVFSGYIPNKRDTDLFDSIKQSRQNTKAKQYG